MAYKGLLVLLVVHCLLFQQVYGHGYMIEPPARNSIWRVMRDRIPQDKINYTDNELFCGGRGGLERNGGRCGICGDPLDGERKYETGGSMVTQIIGKSYGQGQVITVTLQLTANHGGTHRFAICPRNSWWERETEACFRPVPLADGRESITIPRETGSHNIINLRLPSDIKCSNCILRWHWDSHVTKEVYRNCADISVGDGSGPSPPQPPPQPPRPDPPVPPPTHCTPFDEVCKGDHFSQSTCCSGLYCHKPNPNWAEGRCYNRLKLKSPSTTDEMNDVKDKNIDYEYHVGHDND